MPHIKVVEFQNGKWGVRIGRLFTSYASYTGSSACYRRGSPEFPDRAQMTREKAKEVAETWRNRYVKEK